MSGALVSIHDQFHLELKLTHPLEVMPRKGRLFEVWLYFPNSLGIDEPQFRKEDYYSDLTAYVRFQTPHMGLGALFGDVPNDGSGEPNVELPRGPWSKLRLLSPFVWLHRCEAEILAGTDGGKALRELRLLGASFRSIQRDTTHFLVTGLRLAALAAGRAEHHVAATRFVNETVAALTRYRALATRLQAGLKASANPRADLHLALDAVDDFMSMHAIEAWFALLTSAGNDPECAAHLRETIHAETLYRTANGLIGSPVDDAAGNEDYVNRVNQLKKWVMGVLHLRLTTNRGAERARDVAFSVAAAVAMTVAVGLQLVALWTVGTPKTPQVAGSTLFAFVALSVGGYILKDGIKDRLKTWFQARIPQWLFDRRQDLCIPGSLTPFGAVEETVGRNNARDVPPGVQKLREEGEDPLAAQERSEEDVVHYRRRLHLDGARTQEQAPEMVALTEILRLNTGRWVRRMDDPIRRLWRLGDDDKAHRVDGRKTYRVTLVMACEGADDSVHYEKRSIVLTRNGLLRVD